LFEKFIADFLKDLYFARDLKYIIRRCFSKSKLSSRSGIQGN